MSISRPIEVVVLNCCVTDTNDTPWRSKTSTILEKSARLAAVNLRVRFDAAQSLTVAEQLQARTNIGAVAAADVGNTDTDFLVIFDGALT